MIPAADQHHVGGADRTQVHALGQYKAGAAERERARRHHPATIPTEFALVGIGLDRSSSEYVSAGQDADRDTRQRGHRPGEADPEDRHSAASAASSRRRNMRAKRISVGLTSPL